MKVTGTLKKALTEKGFCFVSVFIDEEYRDVFLHVSVVPEHMQEQLFLTGASVTGLVKKTFHKGEIKYAFEKVMNIEFHTCLARVKWFNIKKGFGFATALDGDFAEQDVFIHDSVARQCGLDLQSEMPLRICLKRQKDGRLNAISAETSPTILQAVQELTSSTPDLSDSKIGLVKWFNAEKGFGFVVIIDDETGESADHFLARSTLEVHNLKPQDLEPFDVVEVKTFINKKGKSQIGWLRPTGENIAPEEKTWFEGVLTKYTKKTGKGVVRLEWEDDETSEHTFDPSVLIEGLGKGDLKKGDTVLIMIDEDKDGEPVTALRLPFADVEADSVESDDVEAGSIVVELPRRAAEG